MKETAISLLNKNKLVVKTKHRIVACLMLSFNLCFGQKIETGN